LAKGGSAGERSMNDSWMLVVGWVGIVIMAVATGDFVRRVWLMVVG
jgi:hypothetical protein